MIYVIGIGTGDYGDLTINAINALNDCEIIFGYKKYVDLIKKYFPDKKFSAYKMREEILRCEDILEIAGDNDRIAGLISGGDAGIYGMAGLILELADENTNIKIIPGITSAISAAALLGAPLSNDFAVISLSDLMTPRKIIFERIKGAALGDFVICLYNPGSNSRHEIFELACEILSNYLNKNTPAAILKNVGREGQECKILTLGELKGYKPKMNELIIIGNSQTFIRHGKMITPRGYEFKN